MTVQLDWRAIHGWGWRVGVEKSLDHYFLDGTEMGLRARVINCGSGSNFINFGRRVRRGTMLTALSGILHDSARRLPRRVVAWDWQTVIVGWRRFTRCTRKIRIAGWPRRRTTLTGGFRDSASNGGRCDILGIRGNWQISGENESGVRKRWRLRERKERSV